MRIGENAIENRGVRVVTFDAPAATGIGRMKIQAGRGPGKSDGVTGDMTGRARAHRLTPDHRRTGRENGTVREDMPARIIRILRFGSQMTSLATRSQGIERMLGRVIAGDDGR